MRDAEQVIEHVLNLPHKEFGAWPTPLEHRKDEVLGDILIKRDDLCGVGGDARSGVKARKLGGLLGHMQSKGHTRLWMSLGNITNLGPLLKRQAEELDICVDIDLVDDPPLRPATRKALHAAYADESVLQGRSYATAALRLLHQLVISRGRGKLAVPPSPAHPAAILGMARGYLEMADQAQSQFGRLPSSIYLASASGSSVAGLAVGEALRRALGDTPVRIVAAQVVPEPLHIWLNVLFAWTRHYMRPYRLPWPKVTVIAHPEHRAYGRFTSMHEAICAHVKRSHDLAIDPIYGAKAWDVMARDEAGGDIRCFWHCGYTPIWEQLASELRQ